jgi:poly-gamma-glutamate synthesis protein (capsule biosynthesis protein)
VYRAAVIIIWLVLLSISIVPSSLTHAQLNSPDTLSGRVISLDGQPIAGAAIRSTRGDTLSDADGWFALSGESAPDWVTVDHRDYLPRTRAAAPGDPVLFRLTPDDGETITLHFGGDTMFGRRFFDPNQDGDPSDGIIPLTNGVEAHNALLHPVQSLLENADLSIINLESPLSTTPYFDPTQPRPDTIHPTRSFVFATHVDAAGAMALAGIDAVGLGNNHIYDMLAVGIDETLAALDTAGLARFGAGTTEAEAWSPALLDVRGTRVALLACTMIGGLEYDITFIADDAAGKSGAAYCTEGNLTAAVAAARAEADMVAVMLHGGIEYQRPPSSGLVRLTQVAREAGAALVINHTTHIVGGLDWDGGSLAAWSLGNFAFDQTVWQSLETYLLAVHIRRGEVVRAYIEPLMIEGFVPHGVAGGLADFVATGAAGWSAGGFVVEDGALESDFTGRAQPRQTVVDVSPPAQPGTILPLAPGLVSAEFSGGDPRYGRDLLWVGSFEDEVVAAAPSALWAVTDSDEQVGAGLGFDSSSGAQLQRNVDNTGDLVLSHLYRIPLGAERAVSLIGRVRGSDDAAAAVQLSWYDAMRGESFERTGLPLDPEPGDAWSAFRLDAVVPANAIAVGVFLRLSPPDFGTVTAAFDDLRLIAWDEAGAPFRPLHDHVWLTDSGTLTLTQAVLPGAESWVAVD